MIFHPDDVLFVSMTLIYCVEFCLATCIIMIWYCTRIKMPPVMPEPLLRYWKSKCIDPKNISSFESVLKNPWPVRNTANSTSVHHHPSRHYRLQHTQSFIIRMKTRRAETEGVITGVRCVPHKDFQPFGKSSKPRRRGEDEKNSPWTLRRAGLMYTFV